MAPAMDPNMSALLTEQLSERASQDPLAAMLLQQITQTSEAHESGDPDLLDRKLARAKRTIAVLRNEISAANAMAGYVARVLGACPACWGLDHFCRQCLGSGTPGSQDPDIDALVDWISPALHRAGLTLSSTRPVSEQAGQTRRSDDAGA